MDSEILALVKFCSIETGLKILNSQSLRWSSPRLFNDPFELDHHSKPDFTAEGLQKGVIKEAINLLFGPSDPKGKNNRLIAAIARWRDEERFTSEDEAESVLKQLLGPMAQQQQEKVTEYVQQWQQYARAVRICCFCDKPTNMAAWQRYADNHAGIALKFGVGADTSLPDPKKVSYSMTPPLVTSLKEQVAILYGKQAAPTSGEFVEKLLSKNRDNSAEREWRCFDTDTRNTDTDEQLWYANKTFKTNELKAVYLGLGIKPADKETVINLIKKDYKNTRILQAAAPSDRYEVDFVPYGSK